MMQFPDFVPQRETLPVGSVACYAIGDMGL